MLYALFFFAVYDDFVIVYQMWEYDLKTKRVKTCKNRTFP